MPDREILSYYDAAAEQILPFLRGRRVAVRQTFGEKQVYRRHDKTGKRWITITTKDHLLKWVRWHAYEFFPHLRGSGGVWFGLDIDLRNIPLSLGVKVIAVAAEIFDAGNVRYLLKYSGDNGFHFLFDFGSITNTDVPGRNIWDFETTIADTLHTRLEKRLQAGPERTALYTHIPAGDPITEHGAHDAAAQQSILIDESILKRMATLRAPYSLHMKHRQVSVPVAKDDLESFDPAIHATMSAAMEQEHVTPLPTNSVKTLERFLAA